MLKNFQLRSLTQEGFPCKWQFYRKKGGSKIPKFSHATTTDQRQVYIVLTSERTFTRALAILSSFPRLKKLVAFPLCPMRPVLPILCTNSSISDGKSKLMTCLTLSMSSPRAATLVAISTGHRPFLKSAKASSLSCCRRSLKVNENTVQLFLFLEINAWY